MTNLMTVRPTRKYHSRVSIHPSLDIGAISISPALKPVFYMPPETSPIMAYTPLLPVNSLARGANPLNCLVFWFINCLDLVGMFFSAFVILSKVVVFVNDGSSLIKFPMVVLRHLLRFDLGLFLVVFTFISCEGVSMVH